MNEKHKKEYFETLINEYDKGNAKITGNHPKDVEVAIDTFFKAGKILVDHPEIEKIPTEYITKLFKTLSKYPEYHTLLVELVEIVTEGQANG